VVVLTSRVISTRPQFVARPERCGSALSFLRKLAPDGVCAPAIWGSISVYLSPSSTSGALRAVAMRFYRRVPVSMTVDTGFRLVQRP